MKVERGTLVVVALDPTLGHEQRGVRPCIAVSDPAVAASQRYPMIAVIPVTGTPGEGLLYPRLEPGSSGLRKSSYALVDQLRSVDKSRVLQVYGLLRAEELRTVDLGLRLFLGVDQIPASW